MEYWYLKLPTRYFFFSQNTLSREKAITSAAHWFPFLTLAPKCILPLPIESGEKCYTLTHKCVHVTRCKFQTNSIPTLNHREFHISSMDTSVPPPGSLSAPVSRTVPTSLVAAAAAAAARARSVAMAFLPRFGSSSPLPLP